MINRFTNFNSQTATPATTRPTGARACRSKSLGPLALAGLALLGLASPAHADVGSQPGLVDAWAPLLCFQARDDQDLTASKALAAADGNFSTGDFTVTHWFKTTFSEPGGLADVIGNRSSVGHGNFFSVRM